MQNNKVNGGENMDCQSLADNNGCSAVHQCDDASFPAGYLILNSFPTINNLMWNFYDSTYKAKSDISSSMSNLANVFAPMASDGIPIEVIFDIISLGYVTAAAPLWNSVTKTMPAFRNLPDGTDINGIVKDTVNGWVTGGLTLAKDMTKGEAKLEAERDLETRIGAVGEIWANRRKMSATPYGNGRDKGTNELSAESFKQHIKKSLYADLIPRAWRLSNQPLGPFILQTKKTCDEKVDGWVSSESVEKHGFCIDGEQYVLTSAPDPGKNCRYYGDIASCLDDFHDLPGAEELIPRDLSEKEGVKGTPWGNLTVEDIVRGSVATWKMRGDKNEGQINMRDPSIVKDLELYNDPGVENPSDSFFDKVRNDGVRTGGVIALPVCDGYDAQAGWETGFRSVNFSPKDTYPCGY